MSFIKDLFDKLEGRGREVQWLLCNSDALDVQRLEIKVEMLSEDYDLLHVIDEHHE